MEMESMKKEPHSCYCFDRNSNRARPCRRSAPTTEVQAAPGSRNAGHTDCGDVELGERRPGEASPFPHAEGKSGGNR